jgi:glucose/arabinose dehydrogenase/mono/diheme cytochrome c family protein
MNRCLFVAPCFTLTAFCFLIISCTSSSPADVSEIPSDALTISKGERSFVSNCGTCHNFYHVGTGPQLAGITSDTSVRWIRDFIRDPKKLIESGDERAVRLFKAYKTIMPSFGHLPDDEISAIIAYMHTRGKEDKEAGLEDTTDIKNPIPDSIVTSDLLVDVKLVTQIPASADKPPLSRIIKLDYQPATGTLFILDLRGKLYKLVNNEPKLYMDMRALNPAFVDKPGLGTGFGSFAFHPGFEKNGLLYTTHTELPSKASADFQYADSIPVMVQWVLTEWKTDPGSFPFSGKGREILRVNTPTGVHGMQEIAFNPGSKAGDEDYGYLYIAIGDGGSTIIGHPLVSPVAEKIWGSIIRIDPTGTNSRNGKYGIPSTNPFAESQSEGKAPEIYAYGFRNPHRFSWTRSGRLLAANIGERHIEAVYMIFPGRYYGWPIREGTFTEKFFKSTGKIYPIPPDDSIHQIAYPIAQYDHDEGTAIAGGFEYNGSSIPALKGKYLFGDIASGRLFYVNMKHLDPSKQATIMKWNISVNGQATTLSSLCNNKRVELRFGIDKMGEIYLLTKADGKIYKLVSARSERKLKLE